MIAVANLQYGWTLFVHPLHDKFGWSLASIQTAFTIFIVAETWLVPFEGWVVDRFGPKFVVAAGGLAVAAAWTLNSVADSLLLLYLGAALGGVGAGAVYGTCVGNAVRWFPDRRGLAAGLTVAGSAADTFTHAVPLHFCSDPALIAWITSVGAAVSASAAWSAVRSVSYVIS